MKESKKPLVFFLLTTVAPTFLLLAFLASCGLLNEPPRKQEKIENIQRIFMHKPGQYTFYVRQDDQLISRGACISCGEDRGNGKDATIFVDVPEDKDMWAVATYKERHSGYREYEALEFHIHSPEDINGAGWRAGKHGRGMTQVIE